MPELPEVETVRSGLVATIVGRTVQSVDVRGRRSVRRQSHGEFIAAVVDRTVRAVRRVGKYLLVEMDDETLLVIHLRMSGKLLYVPADEPLEPHTHIVMRFGDGGEELRFVDPRTFGEMFVTGPGDTRGLPSELAHLGVDPLNDALDEELLRHLLSRRRTALKAFLLDQRAIAGIGNIYGDEISFRAHLRPDRRTETLRDEDLVVLAAAINEVITQAVRLRGSSLRDVSYRDLFGEIGSYQGEHRVYARTDEPCFVCGSPIQRRRVVGRSAHFCPNCQV